MLGHPEDIQRGKTVSIVVHQGGDRQKWSGRCLVSRPEERKCGIHGYRGKQDVPSRRVR